MPLYDYFCDTCMKSFEVFHSMNSKQAYCPLCGSDKIHKLIGTVGYRADHTWDK